MEINFTSLFGVLSAFWLLFFLLGRWQFKRVKQMTTKLILEEGKRARSLKNSPVIDDLYKQIQPKWESRLKECARFVLHKSELFPVPASPAIVRKRLNFTPAWMGAYLAINGVKLSASDELMTEIEKIVALVPKKRNGKGEKECPQE